MVQKKILIVEDDTNISQLIEYNLEKVGSRCILFANGESAVKYLDRDTVDLIILDIMLPEMNGLEVCKRLKQDPRLSKIPIIMLTAKGEEVDRILGFELGADDYMVKPFSPRELVLRVKAVLKRSGPLEDSADDIITVNNLIVDAPRHKVSVAGADVKLTAMEFKLLSLLMKRRGRVQTREQLLKDVWEMDSDVTTRTIDTHVKRLRQKLGEAGDMLETVRGLGYRFSDDN